MHERRWPWVVTSALLLAAAVAAAGSTYLHWLPCRGALLSSSLLEGYQHGPGPGFSDACLQRMDAGGLPFPYPRNPSEQTAWAAELGVLAMLLAGTAWLVLVLGVRWSLRTKAVAVLPGLATLALAVASRAAAADPDRHPDGTISGWLEVAPEAAALVALTAIWHWQPEVQEGGFAQVVVVAWGASAFGSAHMVVEYVFMVGFSAANWDVPPLTGLFTVITLMLSAVLPLILPVRSSGSPTAAGSGPLTPSEHSARSAAAS
ncbi:hypothetical protein [Ornithinimicrobium sufpigmenti]|uniref:hypothetical protein n=1 Tax=Ornithinimicrobium sufpigmenti TaxID=2508882 RepID=UPI001036C44F|nr:MULTISPECIES: hypothetical protein [unclassified Ornithinimicrobium]